MSRFAVVFAIALGFAIVSTGLAGAQLLSHPEPQLQNSQSALNALSTTTEANNSSNQFSFGASSSLSGVASHSAPTPNLVLNFFGDHSLAFAPGSWILVGGLWIWRGRMKSRWEALGFDSEVFELFVRMRGGKTRVKLLNSLLIPKDRFQLANELGLDWKAVDRHMAMLDKFGFVHEQAAFGRVRIYELTTVGKMLLKLLQSLNEEEGEVVVPVPSAPSPKTEV